MAGVSRPKVVHDGLCFPVTEKDKAGEDVRSTSVTGKAIVAAALRAVDEQAGAKVTEEKKWRFKYNKHYVKMVELGAKSPDAALKIAKAGLGYMYQNFEFLRDGKTYSLEVALDTFKGSFGTGFIEGKKAKPASFELEVPYKGTVLKGDALEKQLDAWVRYGTIEMEAGSAILQVARSKPWLDLSDRYFVLLGAGAAMGPLQVLLALGANVIAVDVPQSIVPNIWKRIIGTARDSCGTLTFPLPLGKSADDYKDDDALCEAAGCNLFTQTPEVKNWLLATHPKKQVCVGGYAYIPGEQFPRVALAMDAIIKSLTEKRKASVAFLCTPSDVHVVPPAAHFASLDNYKKAPAWQKACALLSGGRWCAKNARKCPTDDGGVLYYCDALIVDQGPNYALAKRMQHWRAMVAREGGCIVSSNIAPSTATRSVTQNKMFAYAYEMLPVWRPYEVPGPETSNAVMTALLIHDLNHPMHAGSPAMPLANPQQIFSQGAFHGGTWRCAHTYASIGVPGVLLYYINHFIVRNYLIAYNFAQAAGWAYILYLMGAHLATAGSASYWSVVGPSLVVFQYGALLEIAHPLLNMVKTSAFTTAMQISSRVVVVAICEYVPQVQDLWGVPIFTLAWAFTEMVRYTWYGLNLLGKPPAPLTWLRYSTFILLYPTGVFGEMVLYLTSRKYLLEMPIAFGLNWRHFLDYFVLPGYVPGLPMLYLHMFSQRTKQLKALAEERKKRKSE